MNARRKITKIVGISLSAAAVAVGLTACGSKDSEKEKPVETTEYTVTFNTDGGSAVNSKIVASGGKVTKPTDPTKDGYTFGGWLLNGQPFDFNSAITGNITLTAKWDEAVVEHTVTFKVGENTTTSATVGGKVTKPADPTKEGDTEFVNHVKKVFVFDGWYNGSTKFDFDSVVTEDITLTAVFKEEKVVEDGYEAIQFTLDIASLNLPAGTTTEDKSSKGFILQAGVEARSRNKAWSKTDYSSNTSLANCDLYDMNDGSQSYSFTNSVKITQSAGVKFKASGSGVCKVYAQNGSGSAGELVYITVKNLTDDTSKDLAIPGKASYNSPAAQLSFDVEDGKEYQVLRRDSGTIDVLGVELDAITQVSAETGINIDSKGTEKFFAGTLFNTNGLSVSSVKESGATNPLTSSDYTVTVKDSSNQVVDTTNAFATAGTYTVSVTYKQFDAKTYTITVYDLDSIDLGKNVTIKGDNDGFNGTYINHALQQVYGLNDTLDLDGLTIYALAAEGAYSEKMAHDSVQVSTVDMTTAGEKEVTITLTLNGVSKTETFNIYVVDTAMATEVVDQVTHANIYVNPAYTGVVGAKTTVGAISKECNTFKTIQQALDYLGMQDNTNDVIKNVYLAAGTYNEKLEITLPGTKLIGIMGAEQTKIEWNSVYGIEDEGGFSQITDSTATVAVRRSASNVTIKGITVSNYYNNIASYAGLGGSYVGNGERALALLVQADMFIMEDGKLLGWQDTLETFTGRQYFKNTYICGCVDFIFGTNSTTYFEGCQIEAVKGKASMTDPDKTTAYVTAYKGENQSGTTITYGAIFNDCDFTTSSDFIGKVAIARPWAANSTVAVLNSTLGDKYETSESKTIATGLISNNNVNTLKIKFYNNKKTDNTAFVLTDDLSNVDTTLTAEQAANYVDITKIFGADNGGVQWNNAWDPSFTGIVVDKNTYYNFTGTSEATGTNINLDNTGKENVATGNSLEKDGLTIDCTAGSAAWNQNGGCYNFKPGAKIKFHVPAKSSVKVAFYNASYAAGASINGVYSSTDALKQYFAEESDVEIVVTGDTYIKQIAILADQEAPQAAEVSSLTLSGYPTSDIKIGEDIDLSGLKVKANYSDNTFKYVTDYTTDADDVIASIDAAGKYPVTVSYAEKTASFDLNIVAAGAVTNEVVTFGTAGNYATTNDVIDISGATLGDHKSDGGSKVTGVIKANVKAGGVVYVASYQYYANFSIKVGDAEAQTFSKISGIVQVDSDSVVTITCENSNYITGVYVIYAKGNDVTWDFGTSTVAESDKVVLQKKSQLLSNDLIADATWSDGSSTTKVDFTSNGSYVQINNNAFIAFVIKAGQKATINLYDTKFAVNGVAATDKVVEITATDKDQLIVITATGNSYIDSIVVSTVTE